MTYADAAFVAEKIEMYWRARGYLGIRTWIERRKAHVQAWDGWDVRSNLGADGYPPKEMEAA
jgi:hypothetical protein